MALVEQEGAHEQLQAHAHLWNHTFHFINSMCLKCAVELGIPDIIHKHAHPMTLFELVAALPINSTKTTYMGRLMRLLVHLGFFAVKHIKEREGGVEEGYVLTPSSRLLLTDIETSQSPFLLMALVPMHSTPWNFLSSWFQGNEPTAFETAYGMSSWDHTVHNPEFNDLFSKGMASDSQFVMNVVVKECGFVFEGVRSLVDVGGGNGATAQAIADAFPHVKCTVFDLPHVIATVPKTTKLDAVGGDMFQSIPHADAVLLKWILHNWSDEECVKLLKRCKEAIPCKEEGGKVIIIDMVVNADTDDHKATEQKLRYDVLMMVYFTGKQRKEHEWQKIFTNAGFSDYKIMHVLGLRSIIEVYP